MLSGFFILYEKFNGIISEVTSFINDCCVKKYVARSFP